MRIRRGTGSRLLACGCLVGLYETYDDEVVAILDACAPSCDAHADRQGKRIPLAQVTDADKSPADAGPRRPT